jgi:hypothetical protein
VTAVVVAEGLAIVVLAALVFNLLRTQARVLELLAEAGPAEDAGASGPRQGPALPPRPSRVGLPAAAVRGIDPAGSPAGIDPGGAGVLVLAFLTTRCSTCQELWGAVAGETSGLPGAARLGLVVPGPGLESRRRVAELAPVGVEVVMSADAWDAYQVTGSPWAVVVRDGQVSAEGPVADWAGVVALAAAAD